MNNQFCVFRDRFATMETHHLLLRYRAGGMLPEAEAALLEVLSDRGYAKAALDQKMAPLDIAPERPAPTSPTPKAIVKNSHPDLRWLSLALRLLAAPVLVFFVLLAIPILGNLIVLSGASALGCNTGENAIHSCHFLSWDIGELVYGYMVDAFLVGGANPILSMFAFAAFIRSMLGAAWLSAVVGLYAAREVKRHRLQQQEQLTTPRQDENPGDRQT